MTTPARTPYSACAEEGANLDAALKELGIAAPPSTVQMTEEGGMRVARVAPPLLTPSQTARLIGVVNDGVAMTGNRCQERPVSLGEPYADLSPAPVPGCVECSALDKERHEARKLRKFAAAVVASQRIRNHERGHGA